METNQAWVVEDSYAGALSGLRAGCFLLFFSKNINELNKLVTEFGNKKVIHLENLNYLSILPLLPRLNVLGSIGYQMMLIHRPTKRRHYIYINATVIARRLD